MNTAVNMHKYVYVVPCPSCPLETELSWDNVVVYFGADKIVSQRNSLGVRCQHCGHLITDAERKKIVPKGRWTNAAKDLRAVQKNDRDVSHHQ